MRTKLSLTTVAVVVGAALLAGVNSSPAAGKTVDISKLPSASPKQGVTYAADIKPIFDNSCTKCHGADKPKAKLRLDNLDGALKGAEGGKVIQPGKSTASQLVHSIAYLGDPDHHMPPPDNKAKIPRLTPEQVGLIRAWIDQGAK